jgi:hypothetical protein
MKQICSSVQNMGGYEQTSIEHVARRTTTKTSIGTTFLPLVSIRLASTALNAVVLPVKFNVMPTSTGDDFEVILAKNSTGLSCSGSLRVRLLPTNLPLGNQKQKQVGGQKAYLVELYLLGKVLDTRGSTLRLKRLKIGHCVQAS